MKTIMTKWLLVLAMFSSLPAGANSTEPATNLDELLAKVTASQRADAVVNQERIQRFQLQRNEQRRLLREAQAEVAQQEAISESLKNDIENNKQDLAALEDALREALGSYDELFGVTRQVAGDTLAQLNNSIVSAQFPGREQALADIAQDSKALPSIAQLKELWLVLLREQTQQAKVARFTTAVNGIGGETIETAVTRIGPFTAIADGKFLTYNRDTKRLTELARQPAAVYQRSAERLDNAAPGDLIAATVDPSSGTILSLLVQAPNLLERFHQGGLVGYLVSALAVVGVLIGLQRLVSLWWIGRKVSRQMASNQVAGDNPLGRILKSYDENARSDPKTLELKLDDAVLKEVPKLERGLNTLKVLAAVAPLMGLLGTVIGMILTFQSITLWGTGDPKLMAGGISQALMTTVQGLIAAIPLLLLHSVASGRARLLLQVLQEQSAGLLAKRAEVANG